MSRIKFYSTHLPSNPSHLTGPAIIYAYASSFSVLITNQPKQLNFTKKSVAQMHGHIKKGKLDNIIPMEDLAKVSFYCMSFLIYTKKWILAIEDDMLFFALCTIIAMHWFWNRVKKKFCTMACLYHKQPFISFNIWYIIFRFPVLRLSSHFLQYQRRK